MTINVRGGVHCKAHSVDKKTLSVHVAKPETVALMVALEYRHLNYRIGEENLLVTLITKIAQT